MNLQHSHNPTFEVVPVFVSMQAKGLQQYVSDFATQPCYSDAFQSAVHGPCLLQLLLAALASFSFVLVAGAVSQDTSLVWHEPAAEPDAWWCQEPACLRSPEQRITWKHLVHRAQDHHTTSLSSGI